MKRRNISVKRDFPIEGLKWVPYIIGWIFGLFFMPFWIVLFIVGLITEDKHYFIDILIHNFVYVWGIICIGLILLMIIFSSIIISMVTLPMM